MSTVIADESMKSKLRDLHEAVDVLDDKGTFLGVFKPIGVVLKEQDPSLPFTAEQLTELYRQKSGGTPLADFWRELEAR